MTETKFLDYEGLQSYHNKLVSQLKDLKYDPQRKFDAVEDLLTKSNWKDNINKSGYVYGLQEGLIVTVNKKVWQLVNPEKFNTIINTVGLNVTVKAKETPENLGWQIVSTTADWNINEHVLELTK